MTRFAEVETTADGYLVHCPAHSDSQASLRITVGTKGGVQRVLVKCRANCDTRNVMEAMGLSMRDLAGMEVDKVEFDKLATSQDKLASPGDRARLATELDGYAAALTSEALNYAERRFGVTEVDAQRLGLGFTTALDGHPRLVIPFRDRDEGTLGFQARAMDGAATRWSGPPSPEGASWAKAGFFPGSAQFDDVIITEGPGDALTAACVLGYNAIGIRGAGLTKPAVVDEVMALLDGAEAIIAGDGDNAGRKFASDLAKQLAGRGVTVRVLNLPDGMDLSDWRAQDPFGFYPAFQQAVGSASVVTAMTPTLTTWDTRKYSLSDLGGARFLRDFIESAGSAVKYTPETGFMLLENGVWREDGAQQVRTYAQAVADLVRELTMDACAEAARDDASDAARKRAKQFVEYSRHVQSTRGIDAIIRELQAVEGVPAYISDFDQHPRLLAVRNGVLDLRSGELLPHDRDLMLTRRVDVDYNPDAESALWESYLAKSFENHPEIIPFLRRAIGYGITGFTSEHCFLIHWGHGANGKSVFLDTLSDVFGEHTTTTPFSTFESRSGSGVPNDLAALKGARLVMASEGEQDRPMAEAMLKRVTGGDKITARFMRKEFFSFRPTFLLQLATNHKPKFRGQDGGLWRRVKLIPWDTYIPPEERDGALSDKLVAHHAEAILAWAVRGAMEWFENGLQDPPSIKSATAEYKETSDALAGFIPGVYTADPDAPLLDGGRIYDDYREWAADEGLPSKEIWARRTLFRALEERGYTRHPTPRGSGSSFEGLRRATPDSREPIKPAPEAEPEQDAPKPTGIKRGIKMKRIV
jgi:putative DNA primase/helicase